jgi:hypothetical protein
MCVRHVTQPQQLWAELCRFSQILSKTTVFVYLQHFMTIASERLTRLALLIVDGTGPPGHA